MPLDGRDTRTWSATGVAYSAGEEVAEASKQPVAEIHNRYMSNISGDIVDIFNWANDHVDQHEAGGVDEINLDGLDVGGGGTIGAPSADNVSLSDSSGNQRVRVDLADDLWTDFPAIAEELRLQNGLVLNGGTLDLSSSDLVDGSNQIWDASSESLGSDAMPDDVSQRGNYSALPRHVNVPSADIIDGGDAVGERIRVIQNERLEVTEVGVINEQQNYPSGLELVVRDVSSGVDLVRENTWHVRGSPIGGVTGPATVEVRVENNTGTDQSASGHALLYKG